MRKAGYWLASLVGNHHLQSKVAYTNLWVTAAGKPLHDIMASAVCQWISGTQRHYGGLDGIEMPPVCTLAPLDCWRLDWHPCLPGPLTQLAPAGGNTGPVEESARGMDSYPN